jgi:hypothetical protein
MPPMKAPLIMPWEEREWCEDSEEESLKLEWVVQEHPDPPLQPRPHEQFPLCELFLL